MGGLIKGPEVIAGCRPLLSDPFLHDMDVIIQENGLEICVEGQFCKLIKLIRPCNLAVDNAVPVVLSGMPCKGLFVGCQDIIQNSVPYGMDGHLHSLGICILHHVFKLLPGENGDSPGGAIICIWLAEIGAPGSQGTVSQHFKRANLKPMVSPARVIPFFHKGLQPVQGSKLGLFIDPDRHPSLCIQFPVCLQHPLIGNIVKSQQIICLGGGDSITVEGFGRCQYHLLYVLFGGLRQASVYQVHCIFPEYPVGLTAFIHLIEPALHLGRVSCDAGQPESHGIYHTGMAAGSGKADGMLRGYHIQVTAVGKPPFILKVIVVPSSSPYPGAGLWGLLPDKFLHIFLHP